MGVLEDLQRAREAYERRAWVSAYREFSHIDEDGLVADDFAALATTAFLLGHRNACVQALQRAFQLHVEQGDTLRAVRDAFWLGVVLASGGEHAVAGGWVARAQRLLDQVDGDVVERGYLVIHAMFRCVGEGDFERAYQHAVTITGYGTRFDDPDLLAFGLNAQGRGLSMAGQQTEAQRLLDEAMVGVLTGQVSPVFAGMVYCSMVEACLWVSDYGRMAQWTHALTEWCDHQPGLVAFTGQCAVHRGQLMRLHGSWPEAVQELELAAARYAAAGGGTAVGLAHCERGEVLRLLGEYDAAEAAFAEADRQGCDSTLGRALLRMDLGRVPEAAAAVVRLVAEAQGPVVRSRLLPGVVEVLVAAGRLEEATVLVEELRELALLLGTPALRAAAGWSAALVAVARADGEAALPELRAAIDAWASLSARYETLRCKVLRAQALRLLGDDQGAVDELTRAAEGFTELGAAPALARVRVLLGSGAVPGGLSPRETEVLRLVAAGRSNAEIAAGLVVSEKTVARHLSNIFTKLDVRSRTAAAAFAYEHRMI